MSECEEVARSLLPGYRHHLKMFRDTKDRVTAERYVSIKMRGESYMVKANVAHYLNQIQQENSDGVLPNI